MENTNLGAKFFIDESLIILGTGVMLAAEMFNSAIEAICDFIETRNNEKIKIIKDIAASATEVTIFVWIVLICIEAIEIVKKF